MCSGHRGTGARRSATATALVWALSLCLGASVPSGILAQQPAQDSTLQRSQQRLLEIRRERERLQQEMERLRGRVHSLASELTNIEQQVQTTGRIVSELDLQVAAMGSQIERTTADLIVAEDALFLMNSRSADSLDGRYFGPLPRSAVTGRAHPVWTKEE